MRRINILISALALVAIIWGVRFSVVQERRRTPRYLEAMYAELNKKVFENTLPTARFEWAHLDDAMGKTSQEGDDSFLIRVDRRSHFLDDAELEDTVAHEACHTVTWGKETDAHGALWQACMGRVKANSK